MDMLSRYEVFTMVLTAIMCLTLLGAPVDASGQIPARAAAKIPSMRPDVQDTISTCIAKFEEFSISSGAATAAQRATQREGFDTEIDAVIMGSSVEPLDFALQILLHMENVDNEKEYYACLYLTSRTLAHVDKNLLVDELTYFLDAESEGLRDEAEEWLEELVSEQNAWPRLFNLIDEEASPPESLIVWMFERSGPERSGELFSFLANKFISNQREKNEVVQTERFLRPLDSSRRALSQDERSSGRQPLVRLLSNKHWWVRYHAARVLERKRSMREPQLVDAVLADENELVRNVLGRLPRGSLYRTPEFKEGLTGEELKREREQYIRELGRRGGLDHLGERQRQAIEESRKKNQ